MPTAKQLTTEEYIRYKYFRTIHIELTSNVQNPSTYIYTYREGMFLTRIRHPLHSNCHIGLPVIAVRFAWNFIVIVIKHRVYVN